MKREQTPQDLAAMFMFDEDIASQPSPRLDIASQPSPLVSNAREFSFGYDPLGPPPTISRPGDLNCFVLQNVQNVLSLSRTLVKRSLIAP